MKLIDQKIKDAFGRKIYVGMSDISGEEKFAGLKYLISDKEINKRLAKYPKGLKIGIPNLADCIDITKETYNKIKKLYIIPDYYLAEKWNQLY
jgi:hypothetical protein